MFELDAVFNFCISRMQLYPSLFISILNFFACLTAIHVLRNKFGYAGLCAYMVLASVIGNIQVLYATTYEIIDMKVLLGTVIFCSTFLASDIINREYGSQKARKAVYLTIFMDVFFLVNIVITLGHKPFLGGTRNDFGISADTIKSNMEAICQIFIPIPRILIASYSAYLISQLSEIWLYSKIAHSKNKLQYILHNVFLFMSDVCLDTFVFTVIGMWLLSPEPLGVSGIFQVCSSAIFIRVICNLGNTTYAKIINKHKVV